MSTGNLPSNAPSTSKRRPAVIIALVPAGAILGFLGGLLIEIMVGLIAGTAFSADHPATFSWRFLGSLPGLGALIGRNLGAHPVRPRASQLTRPTRRHADLVASLGCGAWTTPTFSRAFVKWSMLNISCATRCRKTLARLPMPRSGFIILKSLSTSAGTCCVSGALIGSLRRIPMNRGRDLGSRWRDTCSKATGGTPQRSTPDVLT